ncbi:tyrosine-type recombinase/integrase [Sedimentibacter sp.]|uniref:tyrosine-type recombinase/integrase n=1 Tax=Sedimentibacter sp. TaxID=1960295 RepID=UPI00399192CB
MSKEVHKVILYTMYSSGLRVGEVVRLKVKDIDSKRMQIHIEKGKNGSISIIFKS